MFGGRKLPPPSDFYPSRIMKRARVDGPDKTPSSASASGVASGQNVNVNNVHLPKISRKIRACE
ncbi:fungal specific transcription factor [Colletotrichum higginsianum]|nr:fungal specific transcription factor [Colletotrichum higginsianum]